MKRITCLLSCWALIGLVLPEPLWAKGDSPRSSHVASPKYSQEIENYVLFLNKQPLDGDLAKIQGTNLLPYLTRQFRLNDLIRPDLVQKYENSFVLNSSGFNNTLKQAQPYLPFIVNEVSKRNMPGEIALLPFIESGFATQAQSYRGAKGMWQFMPRTGRQYGLDQTNLYDGRDDFYAATMAALDYLEYLHNIFNDWPLAIAAYNAGENRVLQAVNKAKAAGLEPTFDNLSLPRETTHYVPKLLAVRNVIRDHQNYRLNLTKVSNRPSFEAININHPISLKMVAEMAGVSEREVQALNPGYRASIYIPNPKRSLLIPKGSYRKFFNNYTRAVRNDNAHWYVVQVKKSKSVNELARLLNISPQELKLYNNIGGETVARNQTLFFKSATFAPAYESVADGISVVDIYDFEIPMLYNQTRAYRAVYKPRRGGKSKYAKNNRRHSRAGVVKVSNRKGGKKLQTVKKNRSAKMAKTIKKNRAVKKNQAVKKGKTMKKKSGKRK